MTRSICGLLAIAMMSAACGGGDTQVSAAAAPPPTPAAAAQTASAPPVADPAPEPAATVAPVRSVKRAAPSRVTTPRVERAATSSAASPAAIRPAVPEYREFTLPAGTTLALELKSAVASDVSQVEDAVRATLRAAVAIDGQQVLPVGVELAGTVTEADRAGRVKGRAKIVFEFTSLRYDGERLAMRTEPVERIGEATKGEDATKIGVGAGAGAAIGAILGGGKGAAKGAAIGAAAGTGTVLATRGKDVRLEPGDEVITTLTAPLSVRVRLQ